MSKALERVGRPLARVADELLHKRDRRRHIRQFRRVTRVALRERCAEREARSDRPRTATRR